METANTNKYLKAFKIKNISEISKIEIKRRYRILANKYHPDKGGNSNTFRFCHEAYQYLLKLREDFDKKESKKFFNKDFAYYADGSIYDIKNGKWLKFKGQIIDKIY